MADSHSARTKAFISYNRADEEYRKRLYTHLKPYIRNQNIDVWDDTRIEVGALWKDEIKQAIASAKVAILLVSANFLASDFIADNELPPLLDAAKTDGLVIFTIILSPCAFHQTRLAHYQAFNQPSEPLIALSKARQEGIWAKLAEQVADVLRKAAPSEAQNAPSVSPRPIASNTVDNNEKTPGEPTSRQPFYTREIECWSCGGKGYYTGASMSNLHQKIGDCSLCKATGKLLVPSGYRWVKGAHWWSDYKRIVICQSCKTENRYPDTPSFPTYCSNCGAMFT